MSTNPPDWQPIRGFLDGLRPEPMLTVSEWAASHRYLSRESSSEHGLWRNERTPYLVEIMDCLSSSSPVQKVVVQKASQIGMTEAGCNFAGYVIDAAPGPMLIVMPTDTTVQELSKTRIAPMIEASPRLREKVSSPRSRDGANSTGFKAFPGGYLNLIGANSAAGLASKPIRFFMGDEIDRWPMDVDGEGSPIQLAETRTSTFGDRKIFLLSTPTRAGASMIVSEFELTDKRHYFVPCPHCQEMQTLERENLKWECGKPETVLLFCKRCGAGIEERQKTWMLARGEWRVTAPDNIRSDLRGYFINAMYSPYGWKSWEKIARQVEECEDRDGNTIDIAKKIALTNTVDGLPYKGEGEAPEWADLMQRSGHYERGAVPGPVDLITVGIDTQNDRFEAEVLGHARDGQTYSIDFRQIPGDPATVEAWKALEDFLAIKYRREDGSDLLPAMVCIDTGGQRTAHVYKWLNRQSAARVRGIKGRGGPQMEKVAAPRAANRGKSGKAIKATRVWMLGVNLFKEELYARLRLKEREDGTFPPGFCHFPAYGEQYFRGLTAEKMEAGVDSRGYPVTVWILPSHARNEPMDCRVYAMAAAEMIGVYRWRREDWDTMVAKYGRILRAEPKKAEKPKGSDFWGEGRSLW